MIVVILIATVIGYLVAGQRGALAGLLIGLLIFALGTYA